jgi:hypothetical protein
LTHAPTIEMPRIPMFTGFDQMTKPNRIREHHLYNSKGVRAAAPSISNVCKKNWQNRTNL